MATVSVRGIELRIHDRKEALSFAIQRDKDFYEHEILDYLSAHFPVQRTVVDIGANIGNHMVYFANFMQCEAILGFEPVQENFDLLAENVAPYNHVSIAKMAVSDKSTMLRIEPNFNNMGASMIKPDGSVEVVATTLDAIYLMNVTLLKIDAEYHEPYIIEGAKDTLDRCRPLILIEDTNNEYAPLLSDYKMIKNWTKYNTYLYEAI